MSLSDDDLLSRVYAMSGAADDDDDTRRLREIHTAYRSLPEEEPPERGFAELMAAARVKADEMKPAPWWRVLFRAPVLALASVMVLAGGAVLVGRHGDSMKAASPTAPAETAAREKNELALDKAPAPNGATTTIATDRPTKEADRDQQEKAGETPPTPTPGATLGASGHGVATELKPPAQTPAGSASNATPRPVERPATHHAENRQTDAPVEPRAPAPPPAPPAPPPKIDPTSTTTGTTAGGGADGQANDDRKAKTEEAKDEAKKDAAAQPAPDATSPRRGGGSRQPSIDQLVKQCQAAASRGDCPVVKALAARIAKDDAETYRARVVKDEAVARCLK